VFKFRGEGLDRQPVETQIACAASRAKGALSAPTETFDAAITFKHCTTRSLDGFVFSNAKVLAKGALPVEYFADGEIEALAPIKLGIKALDCTLILAPVRRSPATFSTVSVFTPALRRFPSGFQHKLAITTELPLGLSFSQSCERDGALIFGGLTGTIFDESPGADLGYEEAETLPEGWNLVKNAPQ
jgi:hypothetical protein